MTDDRTASQEPYRRLASIAVLDAVDYSGLMDSDEVGTHARWSEMCARLILPSVSDRGGQIVKRTGDGFLIEFGAVVDSVRWALDLQATIASQQQTSSPPLSLRIAIHIGDIIPEENDIFGSDVNIASRMQEYAPPGGIVISAAVHEQVGDIVPYSADDCGLLALKNIRRPIQAFAIFPHDAPPRAQAASRRHIHQPSIAVLRPRLLGGDPIDPYLIEGIVHGIVASLAGLKELFVISSSSTVSLSEATTDKIRIGQGLGVRYILTGAIARHGERLRLFSELTDVVTSEVIWSGRHDMAHGELFTTQEAIAVKIAYSLIPHLRQSELQRALRKPPGSMSAYALVLQALHRFHQAGPSDFQATHDLLNQAIQQDPTYAMAYAWQARWYIARIGRVISPDFAADAKEAQRFALLALEHDPLNPIALAIYGHCMSFLFKQCDRAREAFDRALAVSPNSALAWVFSAPTFIYLGRAAEGVERAERGLMLSPLDPMIAWSHSILALAHYFAGDYQESVRWSRQVVPISSKDSPAYRPLIAGLVALGRLDEAREAARVYAEAAPNFRVGPFLQLYALQDFAALAQYGERLRTAGLPP